MLVRPRQLIVTILIGNELVNIAASSFVGAYLMDIFGPQGLWFAIGLMAVLILIFGEIIPKTLGVTYPVKYAFFAAPILQRFSVLTRLPILAIRRLTGGFMSSPERREQSELITEDEFKSLVEEGRKLALNQLDRVLATLPLLRREDLTTEDVAAADMALVEVGLDSVFPIGDELASQHWH